MTQTVASNPEQGPIATDEELPLWGRLKPQMRRYGSALAVVAVAVLLRLWLDPVLERSGFAIFLMGMLIAAWVGGLGPSLISQTLILFSEAMWFAPAHKIHSPITAEGLISLVAFYSVGGIVAVLSDAWRASQRRLQAKSEEAVARGEQLEATLSCIGDGVLVADANGHITLMNPIASQLTEWPVEECASLPASSVLVLLDEQSQQPVEDPVRRVLREKRVIKGAMRFSLATRSGRSLPVAYTAAPIWDAQERISGIVVLLRDETKRRESEQALRDADRRKDEFLATLAHELRNPLAPICNGIQLVKSCGDDPVLTQEMLDMVDRQARHMVRLVDDLLDVSRITRGKLELRKCQVSIAEIVQNAVEETRPTIEQAQHELTIQVPNEQVSVYADPNRLTQVLSNLLDNAAKYTPPGGRIRLSAVSCDDEVTIEVADNGRGIPSDKLESIFEMFMQVRSTIEGGHVGLGIGLTLVKQLIDMHEGTIAVHSEGIGRGSRFCVRLPAITPKQVKPPDDDSTEIDNASGTSRRVLVVDDHPDVRTVTARLVKLLGHIPYQANDGREGIELAERLLPDVVLMDIGMPRMNGYEAAKHIRETSWGQDITLVAITGWGQEEDRLRTKAAGFNSHLVKPIDVGELKELLQGVPAREASCSVGGDVDSTSRNGHRAEEAERRTGRSDGHQVSLARPS
jgi:PAS domain S-box-containing protein